MSKQQENAITLNNVRMAFGQTLWVAEQVNGQGKPKHSCAGLLTKDHPDLPKLRKAIQDVANAKWGKKAPEILKALVAGDRVCLRNGDAKANYDGFAGNLYVSASTPTRPLVIGQDRQPLEQADGRPYSGCYVNLRISVWAQDNQWGKRINAQLRGVQFVRDGEAFGGGGVASPDEFSDVTDADVDGESPDAGADEFGIMGGAEAESDDANALGL